MKINKKVKSKTCNISKNEISRHLGEGSLNKPNSSWGKYGYLLEQHICYYSVRKKLQYMAWELQLTVQLTWPCSLNTEDKELWR